MARRWTPNETRSLLMGLGAYGVEWFIRHTGPSYDYPNAPKRSVKAIKAKIDRLVGGPRFSHGAYTLESLARRSGYHPKQLHRAQGALNQKWKRTSLRGSFLITDDQAEELMAWLQHDFWNRKRHLYGCVQCGEDGQRPKAWGLCRRCYDKVRRAITLLEARLPAEARAGFEELVKLIQSGRGFRWETLRDLKAMCRSRFLPQI
jgi:hypothetical protein